MKMNMFQKPIECLLVLFGIELLIVSILGWCEGGTFGRIMVFLEGLFLLGMMLYIFRGRKRLYGCIWW